MRTLLTVGLCMIVPAAASAGPIRVRLDARLTPDPRQEWGDWLARSVSAVSPAGAVAVDPAAPVAVSLLRQAPPDLPADDPGNPYRSGATYYRSGYFDLTVRLTDVASGQSGEITYGGRLHADYTYAGHDTYSAASVVWVDAAAQNVRLGGTLYTLSPAGAATPM